MPNPLVVTAVVSIVLASFVAVAGAVVFAILQYAFHQREARRAAFGRPPELPRPTQDDDGEDLKKIIEHGQQHAGRIVRQWSDEKRADGWTDDDIDQYLVERPLLELN